MCLTNWPYYENNNRQDYKCETLIWALAIKIPWTLVTSDCKQNFVEMISNKSIFSCIFSVLYVLILIYIVENIST